MIYRLVKEVFDNNDWDEQERHHAENDEEYMIFRSAEYEGVKENWVATVRGICGVLACMALVFMLGVVGAAEKGIVSLGNAVLLMALGAALFVVMIVLASKFKAPKVRKYRSYCRRSQVGY